MNTDFSYIAGRKLSDGNSILAYESIPTKNKRLVLFCNGSIYEFKSPRYSSNNQKRERPKVVIEETQTLPEVKPKKSFSMKRLGCLLLPLLLLITLIDGGIMLRLLFTFLTGWVTFIFLNLKHIQFNWEMISCEIVALAIGTYGLHSFALWVREEKPWKWKWTLSIVSLSLFLFAASIAMTGIIHQSAWLIKSPIVESRRGWRTKAMGHQKQLLIGLTEYQMTHGKYPESLEKLRTLATCINMPNALLYDQRADGWEPWIYFGNHHNAHPVEEERKQALPLLMTARPHEGKFVFMMTNGSVMLATKEELLDSFPKLLEVLPHLIESL